MAIPSLRRILRERSGSGGYSFNIISYMRLGNLLKKYKEGSERSKEAVNNIIVSLLAKSVSIVCSLLIVPLTINYVNPSQYGVWLALSSIIGWISFFDLGLGNGFRNKFAEAKANGEIDLARQYVSTTYFVLGLIASCVFILIIVLNLFIDWTIVLKVDKTYYNELHKVFAIVSGFFCLNLIANIFSMLLSANQKPGYASAITGLGSIISIVVIYILTLYTDGSLVNLALFFSGIPAVTLLVVSIFSFLFTQYKIYRPSFTKINTKLIRNIIGLGVKFFVIYLSMILIFQIINIVISRELGSIYVTQYNIAYKLFNVYYSIWMLMLAPVWSSFTDAYTKNDVKWMQSIINKYEKVWVIYALAGTLLLLITPFFYKVWIGDQVQIPFALSVEMFLFFISQALAGIYMQSINGIGKVQLQFIIYLCFAVLSWPLLTVSCRWFGITGALIVPTIVYLVQALIGRIQLKMLLNDKAFGIFNK